MDEASERRAEAAYARFRQTRSPQAMAEVFDRIATELLLFARRFAGGAAQAEDLVQQTFVRLIEHAERFDPARRLLPWSMAILANEARQIRRRSAPDGDRLTVREVPEPPAELARRETQQAIDAAMAELPSDHRDVVALRHLHGLPPRRIAAELSIPVGTVKTRLRHGVRRLTASLPPGLAFGAAMSLLAGRGLAATRRTLLVQVGASTTYLPLWGWITMKKTLLAAGAAALIALAALSWAPDGIAPGSAPSSAPAVAIANSAPRGTEPAAAPSTGTRTAAESAPAPAATPAAAAEPVGIEMRVRVLWQAPRRPAANVPLQLFAGERPIAHGWTDATGGADFAVAVAARYWPAGAQVQLIVQTPLAPGRRFGAPAGSERAALEIVLDEGQHVEGAVLDATGSPVAGAEVRLTVAHRHVRGAVVARSDAGGAFVLHGLPVGFELEASAGTRASAPATIRDLTGGERLVLRLDRGGHQLQLHVVAAGQPVVGATVRVELAKVDPNNRRALLGVTTAGGVVTFAGLPAGRHGIEIVHATYPPARRALQTEGDGSTRVETVELGATARLDCIVRRGGRPFPGVMVMINEADSLLYEEAQTDHDGRFTADRLAVGSYRLFFLTRNTTASRQLELRAGEQTVAIDLPGGIAIRGRLLLPDGSPAVGWGIAALAVNSPDRPTHTVTRADGTFVVDEQEPAHYRLRANGPDGGEHEFVVLRTDGQPADYHLPSAALWQLASIVGQLEIPLEGAVFRLEHARGANGPGSRAYETVAADGTFGAGPLAPGRFRVWLEHDDEVRWLTELDLASGERKDLGVVTLPRCGTLTVALRHTDGIDTSTAVPQLRSALLTDGYALGPRLLPASDGRWHAARVPAGSWWVVVRGNGVAPELREVFIAPDAPHHVEIPVAPAVEVVLQLDAGGAEAEEVGVRRETVRRSSDRVVVHHQEGMGPLRTERELGPGSYTIEIATAGGFHGLATFAVPSETPIVVRLARR
ncbi:MAG: sigma-70 family RNA polymerase sigma factor [Planctomycetes bacterium]|nr:sigma-70 family RNA polymerase sigma factor [Planctomycetota bacterium]